VAWVPKTRQARRIASRCLRASQAGAIELAVQDRIACVDAVTTPFVSVAVRSRLAGVWRRYGALLPAPSERAPEDDELDEACPLA
jgi:hypothetical protein